jgi:hypothetical protein
MNEKTGHETLTNNHIVAVINGGESAHQAARELEAAATRPSSSPERRRPLIDARREQQCLARILSAVEDHLSEATKS